MPWRTLIRACQVLQVFSFRSLAWSVSKANGVENVCFQCDNLIIYVLYEF